MLVAGAALCIGGPALVIYVTPTEEELFKRYNPELQKRSLANRENTQKDFDTFVGKLKQYSKSDKHIWDAAADDDARTKLIPLEDRQPAKAELQKRREEMTADLAK